MAECLEKLMEMMEVEILVNEVTKVAVILEAFEVDKWAKEAIWEVDLMVASAHSEDMTEKVVMGLEEKMAVDRGNMQVGNAFRVDHISQKYFDHLCNHNARLRLHHSCDFDRVV